MLLKSASAVIFQYSVEAAPIPISPEALARLKAFKDQPDPWEWHARRVPGGWNGPEHRAWIAMVKRCTNPKDVAYQHYGGRGITVCSRWLESYEAFWEDMGRRPSADHSLDRIDVDGDYEPSNCRWATKQQQMQNMRRTVRVNLDGEQLCLAEACRRVGIPYHVASQRRARGWSPDRWLEPVQ